jgi:tetratricopeptide (TPR) repeat protein
MKSLKSYKQGSAKIRREWVARRYEKALAEAARLLQEWPDNPSLLVMWADLIQLQAADRGPPLEQARAAYERAADLDSEGAAPLIELGHFHYAVEDDASAASKAYAKAIERSKTLLIDALLGQAKALTELGRKPEALACLAQAHWLQSGHSETSNGKAREDIMRQFSEATQGK